MTDTPGSAVPPDEPSPPTVTAAAPPWSPPVDEPTAPPLSTPPPLPQATPSGGALPGLTGVEALRWGLAAGRGLAIGAAAVAGLSLVCLVGISLGLSDHHAAVDSGAYGDVGGSTDSFGWLALPVMTVAAALGGSIRLGFSEAALHLTYTPLLLTGLALAPVVWWARREQRTRGGTIGWAGVILAVGSGLLLMIVLDLIEWAVSLHGQVLGVDLSLSGAGSRLLLVGTLFVAVAQLVGRLTVLVPVIPLEDWQQGFLTRVRAAVWHLTTGGAVLLPIVLVYVLAHTGHKVATLFSAPLWLVNASIAALSLGHLGAINAGGTGDFGVSSGSSVWIGTPGVPWYFGLLVVVALAAVLTTGVRMALQRPPQSSFTPLAAATPAVFAGVWLVITVLFVRIHLSVGGSAFGGSASVSGSVSLAAWVFLLMAGWGVLIEATAVYVAPRLVGPGRPWVLRLGGGSLHPAWLPGYLGPPVPEAGDASLDGATVGGLDASGAPVDRPTGSVPAAYLPPRPLMTRRTKMLVGGIGGGALLLVVAAVAAVQVVDHTRYTPDGPARAYLTALQEGHVDHALQLGSVTVDPSSRALLAPGITATERPQSVHVDSTTTDGSTARVVIAYSVASTPLTQTFTLHRSGHVNGLFTRWVLDPVALGTVEIDTDNLAAVNVNGSSVPVDDQGEVQSDALPGKYTIGASDPGGWVTADAKTLLVKPSAGPDDFTGFGASVELAGGPSQKLTDEVDAQVVAYVKACAAKKSAAPANCPFSYYDDSVKSPRWTVTSMPTVELSEGDTAGSWSFNTDTSGVVHFNATQEDPFFGSSKVSEDDDVYVAGDVTINGDEATVTFSDSGF